MTEWQLIETALKDGTEVLGFDGVGQRVMRWESSLLFGECWFIPGSTKGYGDGLTNWKPTHWMPLPEPPKALE